MSGRWSEPFALAVQRYQAASAVAGGDCLECTPQEVGLFRWSLCGGMLSCNDAFAQMLGYPGHESLVTAPSVELHASVDARERFVEMLRSNGAVRGCEQEWQHADGSSVWCLVTATLVSDAVGNPTVVDGTAVDISERKRAEEHLLHVQRMEVVGRLAGGVAHDFNNLLQAFSTISLELRRIDDVDQRHGYLDELDNLVERGAQLSRQLLQFSRRRGHEPERLDLSDALVGTASLLRRLLRENIELVCEQGAEPLWVDIDRGHLDQVVVNLAINGQDAMPEGGTLQMSTAGDDGVAVIEVEDSGPGVPERMRESVFRPFFTTKDASRGTGLGLSVVHGIVAQAGGEVEIGEGRDGGALFRVVLPRSGECDDRRRTPEEHAEPEVAEGGAATALVVEDDRFVREGLEGMLELFGYRVTAVGQRAEALQLEDQGPFDVLLCDVVLPDGNGAQLAGELAQRWPGMQVVLMSGYLEETVRAPAVGAGFQVLEKPFSSRELARVLRSSEKL